MECFRQLVWRVSMVSWRAPISVLAAEGFRVFVHGFSGMMRAASFSSDFLLPGAYVWFIAEALSTGFFGYSGHVVIWFCFIVTGTFILVSESGSRRR
ncbi:hypothetical protein F2Q69_00023101 [Brassica cretica]|uniref:Uncharacterized protein n=1 Tax=Brassica cretica TaxID=69181 RepID=A0A8S9Q4Y0_BRACR|nr:hypothetical protein F2Q69_00023101 [Brassica cretica]